MLHKNEENPEALAGATGSGIRSLRRGVNSPEIKPNQRAKQAEIAGACDVQAIQRFPHSVARTDEALAVLGIEAERASIRAFQWKRVFSENSGGLTGLPALTPRQRE